MNTVMIDGRNIFAFCHSCGEPIDEPNLPKFAIVDLQAVWTELRPLMEHPVMVAEMEKAIRSFISDHNLMNIPSWEWIPADPWRLDLALNGHHPAPWKFTLSDGWVMEVDQRVEAALEGGDPEAILAYDGYQVAQAAAERGADPALVKLLETMSSEAYRKFAPHPDEGPDWWTPMHACFWFADAAASLGELWKPEGDWIAIRGRGHAFAADLNNELILDLLWRPDWKLHPCEQLMQPALGEEVNPTDASSRASKAPSAKHTVTMFPPKPAQAQEPA
ncbi:hypothetical protein [Thiohalocapsa halophila]|uniref:hypothetical protein n=1 Tax=Thiohalocapsa halophila TaxID=69359 RepID=UPI001905037F|nr:hypothetical protein [Thiohalocapsa halophila]